MGRWQDFEERYGERREEHESDGSRCPDCGTVVERIEIAATRYQPGVDVMYCVGCGWEGESE